MISHLGAGDSVISYVDTLLVHAIERNVSDIHLEPTGDGLRVRFRIDGVLHDQKKFDESIASQIIGRLKILSRLNITHKRIPQDGKFTFQNAKKAIDVRVSTFPTIFGEKVVLRILDPYAQAIALNQLGMSEVIYKTLLALIVKPQGFFLVTGPTGSGKTTTLYAILQQLYSPEKNMVTLEDPVEYTLSGITQSPMYAAAGFTFEQGMRSVLRQDPDVIMIGEVRDTQTAQVAIQAALTGHVVVSSLHTNDAPSAVIRLIDMGVDPFLINATVTGIMAQRLARAICSSCKVSYEPSIREQEIIQAYGHDFSLLYKGNGCVACNYTGYKGRVGIFELLIPSAAFKNIVSNNADYGQLLAQAKRDGMESLSVDAFKKVQSGSIPLAEALRVIL